MNERIQKLAEQAEDYATAEYEKWIPTPDFSGIPNIRKIFNKKFAELIVRECMQQVEEQYKPILEDETMMKDIRWAYYVDCGVDSYVAIREHFYGEQE